MDEGMTEREFVRQQRLVTGDGGPVTRSKKKRAQGEPTIISDLSAAAEAAQGLIRQHHHHLASANIVFLCTNKAIKGLGGKVQKASPLLKYLSRNELNTEQNDGQVDFIVTISLVTWNEANEKRRMALLDHLLTRMVGEEDNEDGRMKWKVREPEVQEFPEIAERYGAWNDKLRELGDCLPHE